MGSETICRRVIYHGRVQGVGFRATVRSLVSPPVTGYVRNLGDGTVELVVCGPDPNVRDLLSRIAERMASHIASTDDHACVDCEPATDFRIRY